MVSPSSSLTFSINSVVWVRFRGYPWWPGVVVPDQFHSFSGVKTRRRRKSASMICVNLFCDGTTASVPLSNVCDFKTNLDLQVTAGIYETRISLAVEAAKTWMARTSYIESQEHIPLNTVVWARIPSFPWWPAVVVPGQFELFTKQAKDGYELNIDEPDKICVCFFADGSLATVQKVHARIFHENLRLKVSSGPHKEVIETAVGAAVQWMAEGVQLILPYSFSNGSPSLAPIAFPELAVEGKN